MKVALISPYSWRPHIEHLIYLSRLLKSGGHQCIFLKCGGGTKQCYNKLNHEKIPGFLECAACNVGSFNAFSGAESIETLKNFQHEFEESVDINALEKWASSSAATLTGVECKRDLESNHFLKIKDLLTTPVEYGYQAAYNFFKTNQIDAALLFNGRIDITRGILEAAKKCNINVVCVEATLAGHGLLMLPNENCLGLSAINKIVSEWAKYHITQKQAQASANFIAQRFSGGNPLEWKNYQKFSDYEWVVDENQPRVLIAPGSKSETLFHGDWESEWPEESFAFDAVLRGLGIDFSSVILRMHPGWVSKKPSEGHYSYAEKYYLNWANKNNIKVIESNANISTQDLIKKCDIFLTNLSSGSIEAAGIGKPVICTNSTWLSGSGMVYEANNSAQLKKLAQNFNWRGAAKKEASINRIRHTLRFLTTYNMRIPQFTDFVRAKSRLEYCYRGGADPERLVRMLQTGRLEVDTIEFYNDFKYEDEYAKLLLSRNFEKLINLSSDEESIFEFKITPKLNYSLIFKLRNLLPRRSI